MIRYGFLTEKDYRVYISEKYHHVYQVLAIEPKTKIFDDFLSLFTFAVAVGIKFDKMNTLEDRHINGQRLQTIKEHHSNVLYTAMFINDLINEGVEKLTSNNYVVQSIKHIEQYADAGMEIMMNSFLNKNFDGLFLRSNYKGYVEDFSNFILENMVLHKENIKIDVEKTKTDIKLSETTKLIIRAQNHSVGFMQVTPCSKDIFPLKCEAEFLDDTLKIISETHMFSLDSKSDSIADIKRIFHLKHPRNKYSAILIVRDVETRSEVLKVKFDVDVPFASNLI